MKAKNIGGGGDDDDDDANSNIGSRGTTAAAAGSGGGTRQGDWKGGGGSGNFSSPIIPRQPQQQLKEITALCTILSSVVAIDAIVTRSLHNNLHRSQGLRTTLRDIAKSVR